MKPSADSILTRLETELAQRREQMELHTREEARHRAERERLTQEMEDLARTVEAFRASYGSAVQLVGSGPRPQEDAEAAGDAAGDHRTLTRLVTRVISGKEGDERFGPVELTREVNRRFSDALRKPVEIRQVSDVLRRMARAGRIHQVRRGRPHHEALYAQERPSST